ncbi:MULTISPECIES: TRAP transporter large permease [Desulfotignum]|jgi:C4-dicarboxylate transporter DctM subunit|uniref:TRAP-type C4-dicarboxylate permease, large subunit DctM n=2 Tax=Desulfotignum TaxID=115780 RepID=S0FUU7_9BACT|nr:MULTISPECIES: TRAP transporter large permease [Desulfotignum]EMS78863.1 TRAP-type C4-dicarboxylate permease, large subunit DctM [Desulfotignum phosphitoxidans DSM 13687]MBG0778617.1 TRAP transporter large permease [Desulfotignum balticum]
MISSVLFGAFGILLVIGAPIAVALGMAAMAAFMSIGKDVTTLVQIAYNAVNSFPVMALPAFILSGALMQGSGISRRLVAVAEVLAGRMAGGLGASTVLACLFFGAISGSGPATTAAVGMLMIPAMTRKGYDRGYASAVTASSGGLGIVIPPSIPMVIYGVTASVSITQLFIAGVFPGLLIASGIIILNYVISKKKGYKPNEDEWSLKKTLVTIKDGFWALMAPVVILGGIYSGFFTPTEAAIVSIFYTLFVGIFIYQELKLPAIFKSLDSTTWLSGRVLIILFTAQAFGRLLVQYKIPDAIAAWLLALTGNVFIIWALVIIFLIMIGMFMETLATIMLVTPVLLPVMTSLGVDPIHFGVVLVMCCEIGFETPPLGENLFIASGIGKVSIEEISVKAIPFSIVEILAVFTVAYIPGFCLWLPKAFGY